MADLHDDGGPAFPILENNGQGTLQLTCVGMSLRDYFIAHAPADPQPWFTPTMPQPCPQRPPRPADLTPEEVKALEGWGDYYGAKDILEPRARAYAEECEYADKKSRIWSAEATKQQLVQWPAAWADAMLAERKRHG